MSVFNVAMIGDKELIAKFDAMPSRVRAALERKVYYLVYRLLAMVKGKLSGEVLHVRSGLLRDSAFERVQISERAVFGEVVEPGSVPYAAIHEFGGTINVPDIVPVKAKALLFANGKFSMYARAHVVKMPERSYLRSSLADMRAEIEAGLQEAVLEGTSIL